MKKYLILSLVIILFEVNYLFAQSEGSFDLTFAENGYALTDFGCSNNGSGVAIQDDGKIVVCGTSASGTSNISVARYNTNGSLDKSFGSSGLGYITIVYEATNETTTDIVIQPDGKIVVSGYSSTTIEDVDFIVIRLTIGGELDKTFSTDGTASINFGDSDIANSITLQDDGKIILFGTTRNKEEDNNIAICRVNSNGSIDKSFGSNGKTIVDINYGSADFGRGVKTHNGDIYAAALSYGDNNDDALVVLNFDSSGHLNSGFGSSGLLSITMELQDMIMSAVTDLDITKDNKIIVSSHETNNEGIDFAVARVLMNGFPDEGFGTHGLVITDMIGDNNSFSIIAQDDGKILLGGYHDDNINGFDFTIARYLSNGDLDAEFGNHHGVTWENLSPYQSYPADVIISMEIQSDGKIIAVGYARGKNDIDLAIARFNSSFEVDIFDMPVNTKIINCISKVVDNTLYINYELEQASFVNISLYDCSGRGLQTLINANRSAGKYRESFPYTSNVTSAICFLRTTIGGCSVVSKLVIIK